MYYKVLHKYMDLVSSQCDLTHMHVYTSLLRITEQHRHVLCSSTVQAFHSVQNINIKHLIRTRLHIFYNKAYARDLALLIQNLYHLLSLRSSLPPQPAFGSSSPTLCKNKLPSVSHLINPQQRNTLTPSSMAGGLTDSKASIKSLII